MTVALVARGVELLGLWGAPKTEMAQKKITPAVGATFKNSAREKVQSLAFIYVVLAFSRAEF
jgi:hypothetical protein